MNASIHERLRMPQRPLFWALIALSMTSAACSSDPADATAPRTLRPAFDEFQNEDLLPSSDLSNPGSWGTTATTLAGAMGESTPNDDTDYIYRVRLGLPPTTSEATVELSDPVGTPSSSQAHTLKVRWKVTGNYSTTTPQPTLLTYSLLDGSNVIATGTANPSGSYVTASRALLQSEIDNISGYSWLRVKLNAQLKPAGANDQIEARVTWAVLEIR